MTFRRQRNHVASGRQQNAGIGAAVFQRIDRNDRVNIGRELAALPVRRHRTDNDNAGIDRAGHESREQRIPRTRETEIDDICTCFDCRGERLGERKGIAFRPVSAPAARQHALKSNNLASGAIPTMPIPLFVTAAITPATAVPCASALKARSSLSTKLRAKTFVGRSG